MTRCVARAGGLFLALACAQEPPVTLPDPTITATELLAADRAHGADSAARTVTDAVGGLFTDDVMMPTPAGTLAHGRQAAIEALRANPANATARVTWRPIRAGVSADGQHGFTFGFMTTTAPDSVRTELKYLAYWVRENGAWRIAAYKRARRASGAVTDSVRSPAVPPAAVAVNPDTAQTAALARELAAAEQAFSDEAGRAGLETAFRNNGAADAMNLGGPARADFVYGADSIGALVGTGQPPGGTALSWRADDVLVASSGDLGVTFGFIVIPGAGSAGDARRVPFFTVWRRDGPSMPWRYVAE